MFLLPGAKKQPTPKAKRKPSAGGMDSQLPLGGDLWRAGELSKDKPSSEPFDDNFVVGDEGHEDDPIVDETEGDEVDPSVDVEARAGDGDDSGEWFDEPALSDDPDEGERDDAAGDAEAREDEEEDVDVDESSVDADSPEDSREEDRADAMPAYAAPVDVDAPVADAAAEEPPADPPAEPKPTPRRRRKAPPLPPPPARSPLSQFMPWVGFAVTIAIGFACTTWLFLARPVLADRVLATLPGFADLQESVLLSRQMHLSAVEGAYQLIGDRETAFVVSGYATSTAPFPVHDVKVRARLLGANGDVVAEKSIYCGVATTPPVLSDLDSREVSVLQRIQPPRRFAIAPGDDARFLVVFVDPPDGVARFALDVVSASAVRR